MTKGKNFSGNNVKGQRKENDFYATPYSMTEQLLQNEYFDVFKTVLEPACGQNDVVKVLQKYWRSDVIGYDKDVDFLTEVRQFPQLITNPPFSLAKEFILKAKEVVVERFAFLLPLSYLHGRERYFEVYNDTVFPLKNVHVFTRSAMLGDELRPDGKYRSGMMVYAWFVWQRNYVGEPKIKWINNQSFMLSKRN